MAVNRLVFILLVLPLSLTAQVNRYFVSFKDKANTIYSVDNPLAFLSQKSLDRRALEHFTVTTEDFPVNSTYVQQVKGTGAEVYFTSRWFNGVLVQADASLVATISALASVASVELVAPGSRLTGARAPAFNNRSGKFGTLGPLANQTQMHMIALDQMHNDGRYGEGVNIAVFDGGFNGVDTLTAFKHLYQEGRLKDAFNFVQNSTDVYHGYPHGSWVLSIMAGNKPDAYLGGVPKANYFLYQTEDAATEYRIEEYNWLFAAEKADSIGVDVINSSLGYFEFDDASMNYTYENMDGKTTVVARAARKAIERGIVVANAAGNEGANSWHYIISPSDAEGILSAGGVDSKLKYVSFSSVGPSADNRIKPDVSAMAGETVVIGDNGVLWAGNGTSFASPQIASLAAGLRQTFPMASAEEIYGIIIHSASQASHPDNLLGYGIPNYELAKEVNDEFQIYPIPAKISSGLKISFTYPDGQVFNVTIYNAFGQRQYEKQGVVLADDNPYTLDLSPLPPGMYYVSVITATSTRTQKIVVVH